MKSDTTPDAADPDSWRIEIVVMGKVGAQHVRYGNETLSIGVGERICCRALICLSARESVEIFVSDARLADTLNKGSRLVKQFGPKVALQLRLRLAVLAASNTLADVPERRPDGCHQLPGGADQPFAVHAGSVHRILFVPLAPVPKGPNGRVDRRRVTTVTIVAIDRGA